ncbi:MAG: Fic family protein [Eubacteriales bacterium]
MTKQENIFIAKRMVVDNIYRSAKLEGIAITYAQTLDIVDNVTSSNLKPSDLNDIVNLKNGWKYILENLDRELDLGLIKELHTIIGHAMDIPFSEIGEFRQSGVGIGGTTWRPEEPNTERLHNELMVIRKNTDIVDRAMELFLWVQRNQMFRDGNKRIANLISNHELIKNAAGIISIPEDYITEFKKLLVDYYETNQTTRIKEFLHYHCFYSDMEFLSQADRDNN